MTRSSPSASGKMGHGVCLSSAECRRGTQRRPVRALRADSYAPGAATAPAARPAELLAPTGRAAPGAGRTARQAGSVGDAALPAMPPLRSGKLPPVPRYRAGLRIRGLRVQVHQVPRQRSRARASLRPRRRRGAANARRWPPARLPGGQAVRLDACRRRYSAPAPGSSGGSSSGRSSPWSSCGTKRNASSRWADSVGALSGGGEGT